MSKEKQEEKNYVALRALAALEQNRTCFDCGDRGPTYVNVTIGAFVCTSCGGLLRGLNPPHRVKSISMASFSADEINFILTRGNKLCRGSFLANFTEPQKDLSEEHRKREHLQDKYEKRRWYVAPIPANIEAARVANETVVKEAQAPVSRYRYVQRQTTPASNNTKPLSSIVANKAPPAIKSTAAKMPTALDHAPIVTKSIAPPFTNSTSFFTDGLNSLFPTPTSSTAVMPTTSATVLQPALPSSNAPLSIVQASSAEPHQFMSKSCQDRYAAVADLDSLFNSSQDKGSTKAPESKPTTWGTPPSVNPSLPFSAAALIPDTQSTSYPPFNPPAYSNLPSQSQFNFIGNSVSSAATTYPSNLGQPQIARTFDSNLSQNIIKNTSATIVSNPFLQSTSNPFLLGTSTASITPKDQTTYNPFLATAAPTLPIGNNSVSNPFL